MMREESENKIKKKKKLKLIPFLFVPLIFEIVLYTHAKYFNI